jgi:F-type H+-transporting ATPase subunit b
MPQLDPTWFASQLFWLLVSFVTLYFILSKLILPPLLEILARREQTRASDIDQAQSLKTQAEDARLTYERALAEARAKAQQLVNDAVIGQKARAEKAGHELDRQIAARLTDAEQKIRAKKQELMDALTPATAELAEMIVGKLTQRTPAGDKTGSVIHDLLKVRGGQR